MKLIILAFVLILIIYVLFIFYNSNEGFIVHPDNEKLLKNIGMKNIKFLEYSAKIGRKEYSTDRYTVVTRLNDYNLFDTIPKELMDSFERDTGKSYIENSLIIGFEKSGDKNILKLYIEDMDGMFGSEYEINDIPITKYKPITKNKRYSKIEIEKQDGFLFVKKILNPKEFDIIFPIITNYKNSFKKVKEDKEAYMFCIKYKNMNVSSMKHFFKMFNPDVMNTEWFRNAKNKKITWLSFEMDGNGIVSTTVYFLG